MKYIVCLLTGALLVLSACNGDTEDAPDETEETEEDTAEDTQENETETEESTEETETATDEPETDAAEDTEDEHTELETPEDTHTEQAPDTLKTTLEGTESLIPATDQIEFNTRGTDYLELIDEDTFTNEIGYGAFQDYLDITESYDLRNYTDADDSGSSPKDIDDMMPEGLMKNEAEFTEYTHMVVYRYPDDDMENPEMDEPAMMAEISFIFENDALIFSSITPGYYEVDISNSHTVEALGTFTEMSEFTDIDPDVITVAEINHHGYIFQQIMINAEPIDDFPDSVQTASYTIFLGDDVMQMIAYPFMEASQDFPSYSYAIYNMFIDHLAQLESQM